MSGAVGPDGLAWYVAYGSNMLADRLRAYLEGATRAAAGAPPSPTGAAGAGALGHRFGAHRGCTDPTPPRADRALVLDRAVTFRGRSRRWGGGVAFLDRDPRPGTATPARAWLLGLDQIADLVAQEARLAVAPDPAVLAAVAPGGTLALGGGWYDTVLRLGDLDGRAALTVTTAQDLPVTEPTAAYLATLAAGHAEIGPR